MILWHSDELLCDFMAFWWDFLWHSMGFQKAISWDSWFLFTGYNQQQNVIFHGTMDFLFNDGSNGGIHRISGWDFRIHWGGCFDPFFRLGLGKHHDFLVHKKRETPFFSDLMVSSLEFYTGNHGTGSFPTTWVSCRSLIHPVLEKFLQAMKCQTNHLIHQGDSEGQLK